MRGKVCNFETFDIIFNQLQFILLMNKNLFLKTGFVIASFSVLLFFVYLLIDNRIVGFFLGLYFAVLLGGLLRKLYIHLFKEDIFTQYLYLFLIIPIIIFAFVLNKNNKNEDENHENEKKEKVIFQRNFAKNKINSMLDTCNYYEAKLYDNAILFKPKKDNNEYLVSKDINPYSKFVLLKHNSKYDYLIPSFIKCPRDSSELVYIFDEEGTLNVILKLKDIYSTSVEDLKFYLKESQKE